MECSLRTFAAVGKVTVLLFLTLSLTVAGSEGSAKIGVRVFQFTCEFRLPMGRGHLKGLAASDGTRSRIATYWIDPVLFRESPSFL